MLMFIDFYRIKKLWLIFVSQDLSSKMRVFTVSMDPELNRIKMLVEVGERSADVSKYSHKMAKLTKRLGPLELRISWTRSRRCPEMP